MLVTGVGSYPKIGPPAKAPSLRAAIHRLDTGQIDHQEFRRIEDETTREVIQQQVEAGLDMVTDGQVRWEDGQTRFARGIKGFAIHGLIRYFDTNTYYRQPVPEGKLEWQGPITVEDYRLAAASSPRPVKAVVTGPYTLARLSQSGCYGNTASLARELAQILNREALALQETGAPLIQFDEPAIVKWKEDMALLEEVSHTVTRGLTTRTAIYTWFGDIASLAPGFFRLPFQVFGLDFVWGPANWEVLKHFPQNKGLGLGIMDGRNTRIEPVEELVEGIRRAARHVSLDRVHLNPSCGLEYLPRENAVKKLKRLSEAARRAREVLA